MQEDLINNIIKTALGEAKNQNVAITVSVVDAAGHLMAVQRMNGCSFFALDASQKKAVTASQLKAPTHILADVAQKMPDLQRAFDKNPAILILPGGFPIIQNGQVMGGLGVAGGDFMQDKTIAEKAVQVS